MIEKIFTRYKIVDDSNPKLYIYASVFKDSITINTKDGVEFKFVDSKNEMVGAVVKLLAEANTIGFGETK